MRCRRLTKLNLPVRDESSPKLNLLPMVMTDDAAPSSLDCTYNFNFRVTRVKMTPLFVKLSYYPYIRLTPLTNSRRDLPANTVFLR